MNHKYIILLLALVTGISSCYKDDDISPEPTKAYYDIKDNPNDTIQHYKYEFYKKYNSVLVTNVNVADYKYNFNSTNQYRMLPVQQKEELLLKGIKLMEDLFLNIYSVEFLKDNLPVNMIIADSVFNNGTGMYNHILSSCSKNYLAMGEVRAEMKDYTSKQISELKGDLSSRFWVDYLMKVKKVFTVSQDFYAISNGSYGLMMGMGDPNTFDYFSKGFTIYGSLMTMPWGSMVMAPDEKQDMTNWFKWVFTHTPEELKVVCDKYPLMKQKYDILDAAIQKGLGKGIAEILK